MNEEWLDAVSKCIIAISENLNSIPSHARSVFSERALEKLTDALIAARPEEAK